MLGCPQETALETVNLDSVGQSGPHTSAASLQDVGGASQIWFLGAKEQGALSSSEEGPGREGGHEGSTLTHTD